MLALISQRIYLLIVYPLQDTGMKPPDYRLIECLEARRDVAVRVFGDTFDAYLRKSSWKLYEHTISG